MLDQKSIEEKSGKELKNEFNERSIKFESYLNFYSEEPIDFCGFSSDACGFIFSLGKLNRFYFHSEADYKDLYDQMHAFAKKYDYKLSEYNENTFIFNSRFSSAVFTIDKERNSLEANIQVNK